MGRLLMMVMVGSIVTSATSLSGWYFSNVFFAAERSATGGARKGLLTFYAVAESTSRKKSFFKAHGRRLFC